MGRPKLPRHTVLCARCGSPFEVRVKELVRRKYCSRKCAAGDKLNHFVCRYCGREFTSYGAERSYCGSRACASKFFSEQRTKPKHPMVCTRCGQEFFVHPSRAHKAKYCSDKCRLEALHNTRRLYDIEHTYLTPSIRKRIRARDDGLCQLCGSSDKIEVHHLIPYGLYPVNDEDELVCLCSRCHHMLHSGLRYLEKQFNEDHTIASTYANTVAILEAITLKMRHPEARPEDFDLIYHPQTDS